MKVYTTAPFEDPRDARTQFTRLEEIGYKVAAYHGLNKLNHVYSLAAV